MPSSVESKSSRSIQSRPSKVIVNEIKTLQSVKTQFAPNVKFLLIRDGEKQEMEHYFKQRDPRVVHVVLEAFINVAQYQPFQGGSYIPLPGKLQNWLRCALRAVLRSFCRAWTSLVATNIVMYNRFWLAASPHMQLLLGHYPLKLCENGELHYHVCRWGMGNCLHFFCWFVSWIRRIVCLDKRRLMLALFIYLPKAYKYKYV